MVSSVASDFQSRWRGKQFRSKELFSFQYLPSDMSMDPKVGSMIPEDLSTNCSIGSVIQSDPMVKFDSRSWITLDP